MASCVGNICAINCQNLIIGFQVTVEGVGDTFLRHRCICSVGYIHSTEHAETSPKLVQLILVYVYFQSKLYNFVQIILSSHFAIRLENLPYA